MSNIKSNKKKNLNYFHQLSLYFIFQSICCRNRRSNLIDYESAYPLPSQLRANNIRSKFSHIEKVSVKAEENICKLKKLVVSIKPLSVLSLSYSNQPWFRSQEPIELKPSGPPALLL